MDGKRTRRALTARGALLTVLAGALVGALSVLPATAVRYIALRLFEVRTNLRRISDL